jgi:hypothetical protein
MIGVRIILYYTYAESRNVLPSLCSPRETFQSNLSSKLSDGVMSQDFECLPCNCNTSRGPNSVCKYNNVRREKIVVYKAECLLTGKYYMDNTQNHLKIRMQQ